MINDNSGETPAGMAGAMWDDEAATVADMVRQRGDTVTTLTAEEAARWRKATEPVVAAWLKQMKERRLDGAKLLANARTLLAKYEKEPEPVRVERPVQKPEEKPAPTPAEPPAVQAEVPKAAEPAPPPPQAAPVTTAPPRRPRSQPPSPRPPRHPRSQRQSAPSSIFRCNHAGAPDVRQRCNGCPGIRS